MNGSSRWPPDDPREWIGRAHSNLIQAEIGLDQPGIYLEDLCFQAQQAAEKALKAVLMAMGVRSPRTHDLADLLSLLDRTHPLLPDRLIQVAQLTVYAVGARYPGFGEPVTRDEYEAALALAAYVVIWAEKEVGQRMSNPSPTDQDTDASIV